MAQWIDMRNIIFPIGYVWLSANDISPASLFGGSWVKIEDTQAYVFSYGDSNPLPTNLNGNTAIQIQNLPPSGDLFFLERVDGSKNTDRHSPIEAIEGYYNPFEADTSLEGNGADSIQVVTSNEENSSLYRHNYTRDIYKFGGNAPWQPPTFHCFAWKRTG